MAENGYVTREMLPEGVSTSQLVPYEQANLLFAYDAKTEFTMLPEERWKPLNRKQLQELQLALDIKKIPYSIKYQS